MEITAKKVARLYFLNSSTTREKGMISEARVRKLSKFSFQTSTKVDAIATKMAIKAGLIK